MCSSRDYEGRFSLSFKILTRRVLW